MAIMLQHMLSHYKKTLCEWHWYLFPPSSSSSPPLVQGLYYRIGDTLARLHQWTEAEKFHKAALAVQSDHVATQLSYGNMLARNVSTEYLPQCHH